MKKEAKDKHFIKQPWYEGGPGALRRFIAENLKYPQEALANRVEGTVFIKYDIDYQGNVADTKVITGLGHGCDEEAVRLVKMLKFKVEKPRGLRVLFHKNIQIHFRLPKQQTQPEPPPAPQTHLNYQYVPSQPAEESDSPVGKPGGSSYTFTINLE